MPWRFPACQIVALASLKGSHSLRIRGVLSVVSWRHVAVVGLVGLACSCNPSSKYDLTGCLSGVQVVFPSNPDGAITRAKVCLNRVCISQPILRSDGGSMIYVTPPARDLSRSKPWSVNVTVTTVRGTVHASALTTPHQAESDNQTCFVSALMFKAGVLAPTAFQP